MTSKQVIAAADAPAAIGPYSQAVKVGDWLFFSGQLALDCASGELVPGGIAAQTEQVLHNIGAVLNAAGLGFDAVVKTTIYLVDMEDFGVVNEIYGRFFDTDTPPARATVQVAALPKKALLEIEGVALGC
ncbi:MAG: reactive intermediate/imine deaminase [Desulfuromonadales bacterium C00003094]|jgi:2-iminobutanoate/2-iminopropanoate deaminase|nr:MAG: reactive intermediate/imine deaminase [Desulfuromonadales bacterium C00003094]OEU75720.1 MAG: reactive intermediate/imine deaminase [Desulfuromonadales bacterium C00003107]